MSTPQPVAEMLDAARNGDLGTVIRLAREASGQTQAELGTACGYSQPVVSRIERGQRHAYDIRVLQHIAQVLDIPRQLLGLANPDDSTREVPVNRRDFLTSTGALAVSTLLPNTPPSTDQTAEAIRIITAGQRRLDATIPSRELAESVIAHLRMSHRALHGTNGVHHDGEIAAAASEVAGLAGWLHWDMHDLGSARRYYDIAIRAAVNSNNAVLASYMTGSLAAFAADEGDSIEALNLVTAARQQIGDDPPAIADAWLSAVTATAHASAKDEHAAMASLDRADAAAERIPQEHPPLWPWVFSFDTNKVAAHRLACAIRLGKANTALQGARHAGDLLASPTKQAALWRLDHADAYLQAGDIDRAFELATDVIDSPVAQQSSRIINRARRLRRSVSATTPTKVVRDFDDRLRASRL